MLALCVGALLVFAHGAQAQVSTLTVTKTADPLSRPEPGGAFTYTVLLTVNPGQPIAIDSLTDDVYGDLTTRAGSTCANEVAPNGVYQCQFTAAFNGDAGAALTDTVTASVSTLGNGTLSDSDDATVTITDVLPTITVDKTASPLSRPAPGGNFTFSVVVTNTSPEPVAITTLTDNIYGDLETPRPNSTCDAAAVTILAASPGLGSTFSCSFVGSFTGVAGSQQTDTVTATAVDNEDNVATDTDDAVVSITAPPSSIAVDKTATPLSRPEPGGSFSYNVVVTNTGGNPVRIMTLTDDVYGDLTARGTCTEAGNTVLPASPGPDNTYSCSFDAPFNGNAGAALTDTVTATAIDGNMVNVTDTDDATVTITNVAPSINVVKTADPSSRVEPGGTFTFGVTVVNTSAEAVTVTGLLDDVYGNLNGRGTCATGAALAPSGGTYECSFDGAFTGNGGDSQTDTVTVTVVDDDASSVSDSDTATVTLTDRPINVIIGDTTQSNTQTSTTTQSTDQTQSGGGIIIGGGSQEAENESDTSLDNAQSVGGDANSDSIIVGNTNQTNAQIATTEQVADQSRTPAAGSTVIFGGSQSTENESTSTQSNRQNTGTGTATTTTATAKSAAAKKKAKAKAKRKALAKRKAKSRAKARALARARAR